MSRRGRAWLLAAVVTIALCATPRPKRPVHGPARCLHLVFEAGPAWLEPAAVGVVFARAFGSCAGTDAAREPTPPTATSDDLRRALEDPLVRRIEAAPRALSDTQFTALVEAVAQRARREGEDWLVTVLTQPGPSDARSSAASAPPKASPTALGGMVWLTAGSLGPHVTARLGRGSLRGAWTAERLAVWQSEHLDETAPARTWPRSIAAPPDFARELLVHGDADEPFAAGSAPPGWTLISGSVLRARGEAGRWVFCAADSETLVLRQWVPLPEPRRRGTKRTVHLAADYGTADVVVELRCGDAHTSLGAGRTSRSAVLGDGLDEAEVTITVPHTGSGATEQTVANGAFGAPLGGRGLARVSLSVTEE